MYDALSTGARAAHENRSPDASVRIHGSDRAGRERLLRYCARLPFALERLRIEREPAGRSDDDGVRRVFYRPARPTLDGRTLLALSPLEFLDALSRLIPPPHVHRHRYHGVLAPNARLRARVVALERMYRDFKRGGGVWRCPRGEWMGDSARSKGAFRAAFRGRKMAAGWPGDGEGRAEAKRAEDEPLGREPVRMGRG